MKNVYGKELDNFTRLTRHYQDWEVENAKPNKDYITTDYFCPRRDISYDDCLNKLGQLEDTEEELGINLKTFFTVKRRGYIYYKALDGSIRKSKVWAQFFGYDWCWYIRNPKKKDRKRVRMKHFGKTWALTEEALK